MCWIVTPSMQLLTNAVNKQSPWRCELLHVRLKAALPTLKPFKIHTNDATNLQLDNNDDNDVPPDDYYYDEE
jgi:hypothetical protein